MIKLDEGNVLLKPTHRKQLMSGLKRSLRLGQRLGDFLLTITLHRTGHQIEVRAVVHDTAGDFNCRVRQSDWRTAIRNLIRKLASALHTQCVQQHTRGLAA